MSPHFFRSNHHKSQRNQSAQQKKGNPGKPPKKEGKIRKTISPTEDHKKLVNKLHSKIRRTLAAEVSSKTKRQVYGPAGAQRLLTPPTERKVRQALTKGQMNLREYYAQTQPITDLLAPRNLELERTVPERKPASIGDNPNSSHGKTSMSYQAGASKSNTTRKNDRKTDGGRKRKRGIGLINSERQPGQGNSMPKRPFPARIGENQHQELTSPYQDMTIKELVNILLDLNVPLVEIAEELDMSERCLQEYMNGTQTISSWPEIFKF